MDNFSEWGEIIKNSPFSKNIIYKVGRNEKIIPAIISHHHDEYSTSEISIETNKIELGDNVKFVIDEVDYRIVSSFETSVSTLKIWIEKDE